MFKELPFNPRYKFNLEGACIFRGETCGGSDAVFEIEDFESGKRRTFSGKWLGLLAHHEVRLPFDVLHHIGFVACDAAHFRFKSGHLMVFYRPIVVEQGFRVVPGFTRYHISKDGIVKTISTGNVAKVGMNAWGYPTVNVFDDDKRVYRNVVLHLLLARAWLPNKDPQCKLFVNHKDGVKSNYSLNNLEWVTGSENTRHANETGLRKSAVGCQVLDLTNGSISDYTSLGEARKAIGIGVGAPGPIQRRVNGEVVPIVLGNRFVVRTQADPPFLGNLEEYTNLFSKHNRGPYYAKKIDTGEIFKGESLFELSNLTGVRYTRISRAINSVVPLSFNGFIFKNTEEAAWPEQYFNSESTKRRTFLLENLETGEITELESLNELRRIVKADKITIGRKLRAGKPYKNWFFKETTKLDSPLRRRRLSSVSLTAGNS